MNRFKNLVWTAVLAVLCAAVAVVSAVIGASAEIVTGFGLAGAILAILTPRP
jgi:hypothetical protein